MTEQKKKRGRSLSEKLNLTTVIMFLLVTLGLLAISYRAHQGIIDRTYFSWAVSGAKKTAELADSAEVAWFRACVDTEEFRKLRQSAWEAEDESMILNWMKTKPGSGIKHNEGMVRDALESENLNQTEFDSLYYDYCMLRQVLKYACDDGPIAYVSLEYAKDGKVYYLLDPFSEAFLINSIDEEAPEEALEGENRSVPPTLFKSSNAETGWLCTAYEPVIDAVSGKGTAMVTADVNMNRIVHEEQLFLRQSILMILGITLAGIVINILLVRKIATKPLVKLTAATCSFADGSEKLTRDDIIEVDIHSRDEINDLYQEIRKMQERIVDYADDLTRVTAEQERGKTELRLAQSIQTSMLPGSFPAFPERKDFDLYAFMKPAKEVGGDFYDFALIDEDHLMLTIADVAGKGVPGALFMMSSMIMLRDRIKDGNGAEEILADVNNRICESNQTDMFVTAWLGILDLRTGTMDCCNAGHEYPMLRGTDGVYRMLKDRHGPPLGAVENVKYHGYQLKLEPGNAVFVYTDGIPEASDREQRMYGTERLLEGLNAKPSGSPEKTICDCVESVHAFVGDAEQFDDLTALCLRYDGPGEKK